MSPVHTGTSVLWIQFTPLSSDIRRMTGVGSRGCGLTADHEPLAGDAISTDQGDSVFGSGPVARVGKKIRPAFLALWLCAVGVVPSATLAADELDVESLLAATREQLQQVREYAATLVAQLKQLKTDLDSAEGLNQAQNQRIAELEQRLGQIQISAPGERATLETDFFGQLASVHGPSPVIHVADDHVRIASDQIFVFGTGELGAEGRRRLAPMTAALLQALALLPDQAGWRLRIEGHTDSRPLRNSARFPSNWELSAARAVAVLRYLKERGVSENRLLAVGYAATQRLDPADTKAAHRRNRRVEIRLEFDPVLAGGKPG